MGTLDASALSQMMLDRSLSPSIASSVSRRGCRRAVWSPVGGDARGRCALAVLSHDHRLSIHTEKLLENGWEELTCLSTRLYDLSTMSGFSHAEAAEEPLASRPVFARYRRKVGRDCSMEFLRFQARTYSLCTDMMEWSTPIDDEDGRLLDPTWVVDAKFPREMVDVRSEEGHIILARKRRVFAFLFSLTISGHLIVWKAYLPLTNEEDVQLLSIFHLGLLQPTAISPFQPSSLGDKTGLLAVGFHSGVVKFVKIDWSDMENVTIRLLPDDPWEDADDLAVSHVHWYSDAQLSCLVILKQNYIVALQIAPGGAILQRTHVGGITCLGLTGISKLDDSVLISSADGLLLKATFSLDEANEALTIYPERVAINCSGPDFSQCGVAASPNGIYVILAETYALSYDHLRTRDPLRVHIMPAKTVSQAFDIMLESPLAELMESHLLSGYHDCLECIRQGIAAGDELPALLLQQVNARSRWKDFSDFHLKLTRFATDLLMAPTISKTSESVTQLEGAKRLLDNLITWRYVKRILTTWIQREEEEDTRRNSDNVAGTIDQEGGDARREELHSMQLMCEWMETIQPCLVQAQHVADVVDEDVLIRIRARLTNLDPSGKIEETRQSCVVCSRRVPFPLVVGKETTNNPPSSADDSNASASTNGPSSPPPTPNLATTSMAHLATCVAGHQLGRCCRTLLPCSRVPYRVCVVCGATSLDPLSLPQEVMSSEKGLAKLLIINCTFCDGLLISS